MLKTLIVVGGIGFGWQHASHHHPLSTSAHSSKIQQANPTAPSQLSVVASPYTAPLGKPELSLRSGASKEVLWFLKAEWMIVWVTIAYTITTWLTLFAIKRQANDAREAAASSDLITESTLAAIRRQAEAIEKQATHMVASARPFLMIEQRTVGTDYEFWTVNEGSSPAQLLFLNPVPKMSTWSYDEVDPVPSYGANYDNDNSRIINVQWIAPKTDYFIGSFDRSILKDLDEDTKTELNACTREFRVYGAIKYRGMYSKDVFESRYCYRVVPDGMRMSGPPGYNEYT